MAVFQFKYAGCIRRAGMQRWYWSKLSNPTIHEHSNVYTQDMGGKLGSHFELCHMKYEANI
jgi:hypothetical protein